MVLLASGNTHNDINMSKLCNDDIPYNMFSFIIRVFFIIPVCLFGLVTNGVNFVVYRHAVFRKSLNNYFLVMLAVSDCSILLTSSLMLSLPVVAELFGSLDGYMLAANVQKWVRKSFIVGIFRNFFR